MQGGVINAPFYIEGRKRMLEFVEEELMNDEVVEGNNSDDTGIDANMSDEDILDALANSNLRVQKVIPIPRLGVPFTIQAISDRELKRFRNEATRKKKVNGQNVEEFNADMFSGLILGAGLVKPKITKAYAEEKGFASPMGFIRSTLLPGEIQAIVDEITNLSGFGVDLDEDLLKNV